jgi:hypothetical protein
MSYCRFGWESSDAYIFGTTVGGKNFIECCGCLLSDDDDSFPRFDNYGDLLRHINDHRSAGHHILARVDELIREEIEDPKMRWVEVGDVPTEMVPDSGPRYPEDEVFKKYR